MSNCLETDPCCLSWMKLALIVVAVRLGAEVLIALFKMTIKELRWRRQLRKKDVWWAYRTQCIF